MPNPYFQFRQFTIHHDQCSMKVTTDSCLFGAWVADHVKNLDAGKKMLDIGSGSGLLSLMIAQQTDAFIEGIEIQSGDYLQSINNISGTPFKNRIILHHADALQFRYNKKYDIIVSNPPFYQNDLKGTVRGKNIAHHDEGLKLPDLTNLIAGQLMPAGDFYLLLPEKRWSDVQKLVAGAGLFINELAFVHQTEKHEAFRIMLKGSFREGVPHSYKIIIKEEGNYSEVFRQLLQAYYLYL